MPFSSGTYSVAYSFVTEAASPPIEIAKLDAQFTDIATALSNCLLRDGTGLPTATIDFNTQRITGLGNSTTTSGPLTVGQFQSGATRTLGSVAGTNTITGTLTPALTAYTAGMIVVFTPANTNTGATTLNVDSLGALDILKEAGAALIGGELVAGVPALLLLDSGADDWILINSQLPKQPSVAVTNSDYTFSIADLNRVTHHTGVGTQTWTIPPNSSVAFPIGSQIPVSNDAFAGNITIAQGAGVTLHIDGNTGNYTLNDGTAAVLIKTGSDKWIVRA